MIDGTEGGRGRKPLTEDVRMRRRQWKSIVMQLFAETHRPKSEDIAAVTNRLLAQIGSTEKISVGQVNHYFAMPVGAQKSAEKADVRVPTSQAIANALIQALDELGIWHTSEEDLKEDHKESLLSLLGYKNIPIPQNRNDFAPPESEARRGKEDLIRHLRKWASEGNCKQCVIHLYSSIGFHSARDFEVAEALGECVKTGIQVVYIIESAWPEYKSDTMLELLQRMFDSSNIIGEEEKKQLWYLRVPAGNDLKLQTLYMRVGILSRLGHGHANLAGRAGLEALRDATVEAHWIEHVLLAEEEQTGLAASQRSDNIVSEWYFLGSSKAREQIAFPMKEKYKALLTCKPKIGIKPLFSEE
jgi:hypothetical protein